MPITVSIVEDDANVRKALACLVERAEGFSCVGDYPSAEAALKQLPKLAPDVVLMDIHLPGMSGVECIRKLKMLRPGMQFLILTVFENTELIFEALAAGATGYLLKQIAPEQLLTAIEEVHGGGSPMSSHIARKVVQSFQKTALSGKEIGLLSPREQEVLGYLSQGYLYKEIASKMSISFETVHTYIRRIYEKLHVRSRTEAVAKYLRS